MIYCKSHLNKYRRENLRKSPRVQLVNQSKLENSHEKRENLKKKVYT